MLLPKRGNYQLLPKGVVLLSSSKSWLRAPATCFVSQLATVWVQDELVQ